MTALLPSYQQQVSFRPERFNTVVVAENERVKVILACFEPEQFIPVHRPGVDLTLMVLEGEGQVVVGEQKESIGPGSLVFVPAGEARGLKAKTRLVALHVVTPPPTDADHREVMAKLQKEAWL